MSIHNFTIGQLLDKLPPLYRTNDQQKEEWKVVAKLFHPFFRTDLYIMEGSRVCPKHGYFDCQECPEPWSQVLLYGFKWPCDDVSPDYLDWQEIDSINRFGLGYEIDTSWKPRPYVELVKKLYGDIK